MEYGDASGTALFNTRTRQWSMEMISAIDLKGCLPELLGPDAIVGTILPERAKLLGLPQSAIVATGGGDNMMGAIGTGNVKPGCLTASLGTSGVLYAYSDTPVVDPDGAFAGFCSSTGGWLPLLCTMNCTVAIEQLLELFKLDIKEANALAEQSPVGANGILTLPFYNGERSPNLPEGKGVVYGLDMTNTNPSNLIRSAMEAAIFGLKMGLETFQRRGMHFTEVTLIGGGSESPLWRQITADILDLPVRVLHQEENAAFGACLQAMHVHRRVPLAELTKAHLSVDESRGCVPSPQAVSQYKQIYHRYSTLLNALKPVF
jgi:xylulokinase